MWDAVLTASPRQSQFVVTKSWLSLFYRQTKNTSIFCRPFLILRTKLKRFFRNYK